MNTQYIPKLSDFDYNLPEELIAQNPTNPREEAKLLVYDRKNDTITHSQIKYLTDFLTSNSYLLVNKSKVIKARIYGKIDDKEKICEILFHKKISKTTWEILVKPGKYFKIGSKFTPNHFGKPWEIIGISDSGQRVIETSLEEKDLYKVLEEIGKMPLPPYIDKFDGDESFYQTPFGKIEGSVAAPTASLHFTPKVIEDIKSKNIEFLDLVLHVGMGTFQPVKEENLDKHIMHTEIFHVPKETLDKLHNKREITAIGTTALRAIESVDLNNYKSEFQETGIFLKPGDKIKYVDHLFTNFHLPKSTLLMLIACFLSQNKTPEFGIKKVHKIYQEAIENKYRFYSFGDAMLIL